MNESSLSVDWLGGGNDSDPRAKASGGGEARDGEMKASDYLYQLPT